jgi:CheY-like chemotaxis protein
MTKILHIDDDIELGEMLCEYLRGEGFEAEHCANPIEGLKKLADDQCQLVVLDVMMPQQSGLETLKQIRLKYNTPVLMLTARGDNIDRMVPTTTCPNLACLVKLWPVSVQFCGAPMIPATRRSRHFSWAHWKCNPPNARCC